MTRIFIKITRVILDELRIENNTNKSRYNKFNYYFQNINYLVKIKTDVSSSMLDVHV